MLKKEVVVVGGGPGGSSAAKKCVESGLDTLLVEKKKLPRDKVCSGMLVSDLAQDDIQSEFGIIPEEIFTSPSYLKGFMLHVPDEEPQVIKKKIPLAWRKDLDYWMNKKVMQLGGEIWDSTNVKNVILESNGPIKLQIERNGRYEELVTEYLIACDGANSQVRKRLYPELNFPYVQAYRGHYNEKIEIDRDYFHCIFPETNHHRPFFIHNKGDVFLVELSAMAGQLKKFVSRVKIVLDKEYNIDLASKPFHQDGCLMAFFLYGKLLAGDFIPAKENVLIVGEAAGLILPGTLEGIGPAIRSGIIAAQSIIKSKQGGGYADSFYITDLGGLLEKFGKADQVARSMKEQATRGGKYLLDSYRKNMEEGFRL